jgi:NTE family protein
MLGELQGKKIGLVLSGAVAEGAFEAGFLGVLAEAAPRIVTVAGTSSGALNATVVAAGVATGRLKGAAAALQKLWIEHGALRNIEAFDWRNLWHVRGLFSSEGLQRLVLDGLRDVVGDPPAPRVAEVGLTVVTTNLDAVVRMEPAIPLPTYEQAVAFRAEQLLDRGAWPRIAKAAAASASFPVLFAPTDFEGSACIDGGAVNNAPISHVLDDADVDAVVVVTTESPVVPTLKLDGADIAARIASAIINERVAYDLTQAKKDNARYAKVADVLARSGAGDAVSRNVLAALGFRPLDLFLVQPTEPLPGDAFSGFRDKAQRVAYVDAGKRARLTRI